MDVVLAKKDLLRIVDACAPAARASSKATGTPGLVRLDAVGNTLRASVSALTWGAWSQAHAEVDSRDDAGSILVPGEALAAAVRELDDGPLYLVGGSGGGDVELRSVGSFRRVVLPGRVAEGDAELMVQLSGAQTQRVHLGALASALGWVRKVVSRDEARPHICAVRLSVKGECLTAIATDGHRLNVAEVSAPGTPDLAPVLIPRSAARALGSLTERLVWDEDAASIATSTSDSGGRRRAWFAVGGAVVWCDLVGIEFPSYESVLPAEALPEARVSARWLARFLDSAFAVADGSGVKRRDVRVKLTLTANAVRAEARVPGEGWSLADEAVATYAGPPQSRTVNGRYLADALNAGAWGAAMVGDVLVSFQDEDLGPVCLQPDLVGVGRGLLAIIMPVLG